MNADIVLRKTRKLGEILTDPFKLIFRNIKAIFMFNLVYIFLPMILGLTGFSYLQTQLIDFDISIIPIVIIAIVILFIAGINSMVSTYAIIRSAEEDGFEKIEYKSLQQHFFRRYKKGLIFTLSIALLIIGVGLFFAVSISISPVIAAILGFLLFFAAILYIGPLYYLADACYMYENDLDLAEAFGRGREYMAEHWPLIFGTFIVASIIYSFLNYSFAIPFGLIGMLLIDFTDLSDPTSYSFILFNLVQNTISAFFSSFLVQYIGICMYFKYFDLEEQKHGYYMLEKIEKIGQAKAQYFENEGDF